MSTSVQQRALPGSPGVLYKKSALHTKLNVVQH